MKRDIVISLLDAINYYRQQGNKKMPTYYKAKIITVFVNGRFKKPKKIYTPINLTFNEYADLILLELLASDCVY